MTYILKHQQLQYVQNVVNQNLTDKERVQVIATVQDYQQNKNVEQFTKRLIVILKPVGKLELLKDIRKIIYKNHLRKFDDLLNSYHCNKPVTAPFVLSDSFSNVSTVQQNGRSLTAPVILNAHPHSVGNDSTKKIKQFRNLKQKPNFGLPNKNILESATTGVQFKVAAFVQDPAINLGFSICGGKENGLGVYVGHVEKGSKAEDKGIVVGDALIEVNRISLEHIALTSAINLLKNLKQLKFVIRAGKQPLMIRHLEYINPWSSLANQTNKNDSTSRVKRSSRKVLSELADMNSMSDDSPADQRHINMTIDRNNKRSLGFNIRGGAEYGLGIFITSVDRGSSADRCGLHVGDEIIDVNGKIFDHISHQDAANFIKSHSNLALTVKASDKIPEGKQLVEEYSWLKLNGERICSRPGTPATSTRSQSTGTMETDTFNSQHNISPNSNFNSLKSLHFSFQDLSDASQGNNFATQCNNAMVSTSTQSVDGRNYETRSNSKINKRSEIAVQTFDDFSTSTPIHNNLKKDDNSVVQQKFSLDDVQRKLNLESNVHITHYKPLSKHSSVPENLNSTILPTDQSERRLTFSQSSKTELPRCNSLLSNHIELQRSNSLKNHGLQRSTSSLSNHVKSPRPSSSQSFHIELHSTTPTDVVTPENKKSRKLNSQRKASSLLDLSSRQYGKSSSLADFANEFSLYTLDKRKSGSLNNLNSKNSASESFLRRQGAKILGVLSGRRKSKSQDDKRDLFKSALFDDKRQVISNLDEKLKETLTVNEYQKVKKNIGEYLEYGDIEGFTTNILSLFDTSKKYLFIKEIRNILFYYDIGRFDAKVAKHEVEHSLLTSPEPVVVPIIYDKKKNPPRKTLISAVKSSQSGKFKIKTPEEAKHIEITKEEKEKEKLYFHGQSLIDRDSTMQMYGSFRGMPQPSLMYAKMLQSDQPQTLEQNKCSVEAEIEDFSAFLDVEDPVTDDELPNHNVSNVKTKQINGRCILPNPVNKNNFIDKKVNGVNQTKFNDRPDGSSSPRSVIVKIEHPSPHLYQHEDYLDNNNDIMFDDEDHVESVESLYAKVDKKAKTKKDNVLSISDSFARYDIQTGSENNSVLVKNVRINKTKMNKNISYYQDSLDNDSGGGYETMTHLKNNNNSDADSIGYETVRHNNKNYDADSIGYETMRHNLEDTDLYASVEDIKMMHSVVRINKNYESLGLSILGGSDSKTQPDIKVAKVHPGTAASNANIKVGQILISIDGESLTDITHKQAVTLIRNAFQNKSTPVLELVISNA